MKTDFNTNNTNYAADQLPYIPEELEGLFNQIEAEGSSFDFGKLNNFFPQCHPDFPKILFLGCDELKGTNTLEKYQKMTQWLKKPLNHKKRLLCNWIFNGKDAMSRSELIGKVEQNFGKDSETATIVLKAIPKGEKLIERYRFVGNFTANSDLNPIFEVMPTFSGEIKKNNWTPIRSEDKECYQHIEIKEDIEPESKDKAVENKKTEETLKFDEKEDEFKEELIRDNSTNSDQPLEVTQSRNTYNSSEQTFSQVNKSFKQSPIVIP